MYKLEDQEEQLETIHVYFYEEEPKNTHPLSQKTIDAILSIITSIFLLCGIIALCFIPNPPSYIIKTVSVPALYVPVQTDTTTITIVPTGIKTIPTTKATGTLTIYNGSILAQKLPQGFILTGKDGIEIVTDQAVTIPAGNAPEYGIATISAHAVVDGSTGNIKAYDITSVYGTDISIKNLAAFTGGVDPQTVTFATSEDTNKARSIARYTLLTHTKHPTGGRLLAQPCQEMTSQKDLELTVLWACQFVSYTYSPPPGAKVLSAKVRGEIVLLQMKMVARPRMVVVK